MHKQQGNREGRTGCGLGEGGRQAEEGSSANWKPAQKRHKDYSLGKRAKEPLLPKFSILDEEVREA